MIIYLKIMSIKQGFSKGAARKEINFTIVLKKKWLTKNPGLYILHCTGGGGGDLPIQLIGLIDMYLKRHSLQMKLCA